MHQRCSPFGLQPAEQCSFKCRGGSQAEVLYQHEGQLNPNVKRNAKRQQKKAKAAASVADDSGSGSDFDFDTLPDSGDEISD